MNPTPPMDDPANLRHPRWWPQDGTEPDPRWSLANERTLLAYNRTALALVVGGLAVAGSRSAADTPVFFALVGVPLIVLGAAVAAASRRRFLTVQAAMRNNEPLPAPPMTTLLPVGLLIVAIVGFVAAVAQL